LQVHAHAERAGSFGPRLPLDLEGASVDKPAAGERTPPPRATPPPPPRLKARVEELADGSSAAEEPVEATEEEGEGFKAPTPLRAPRPAELSTPGGRWSGDWQSGWSDNLESLAAVAAGKGRLALCANTLPCGHPCKRAAHLAPERGGCLECMCSPCTEAAQLAEDERRRWRPLQDALNMRSRLNGGSELFAASPAKRGLSVSTLEEGEIAPGAAPFSPTSSRLPATMGGTMPSERAANMPAITQIARAKNYAQATAPLRVPASYFAGEGGKFRPKEGTPSSTPPAQRPQREPVEPSAGKAGGLPVSSLPAGWQSASSRSFNRDYYFSQATGERVWSVEDAIRSAAASHAKARAGKSAAGSSAKPKGTDAEWKEFYSKTHSKPYWVNTATDDRTWSMPPGFRK